jgi:F-type H+-transporting ATPase subunit c
MNFFTAATMHYDPAVMESLSRIMIFGQIAAAFAVMTAITTAFGQARIVAQAIEGIARQPESRGSVSTSMIIGCAFAETGGIYGLLIAIILLFANPLVGRFVDLMTQIPVV